MSIINGNGALVAHYTYDAWGYPISGSSPSSLIGSLNPLRYRGYVYDTEIGLYYLQSRYYSPKTGRFLNADCYTSTGQGLCGNNMFAYCNNNPVCFSDASGKYPDDYFAQIGKQIGSWLGGVLYDAGVALHTYVTNDSPDVVKSNLESKGFAAYKGALVLRVDGLGNAAFSFGIIGMGSGTLSSLSYEDTLNHEYGHYVHFTQIGAMDYLFKVAAPSLASAYLAGKNDVINTYYYDLPWENTADQLGGVTRNYLPYSSKVSSIYYRMTRILSWISLY